jgi:hypothetical protein
MKADRGIDSPGRIECRDSRRAAGSCIGKLRGVAAGQATCWHGGCTNALRPSMRTAFSGLSCRAGASSEFLETKESESRLRDEYCALEGSRTRDTQNHDGTVTNGFRTDGGGGKKKWLRTFRQDEYRVEPRWCHQNGLPLTPTS